MSEMRLLDTEGRRLYLNAEERTAFLKSARTQNPAHCAFAELVPARKPHISLIVLILLATLADEVSYNFSR